MPNDFPWDIVIGVPIACLAVGLFIGMQLWYPGPTPIESIFPIVDNVSINLKLYSEGQIALDNNDKLCNLFGLDNSYITEAGDVVCVAAATNAGLNNIVNTTLSELARTKNELYNSTTTVIGQSMFINSYMPNQYYCGQIETINYTLPVKQKLQVPKIRLVNKTEKEYEYMYVRFFCNSDTCKVWDTTPIIFHGQLATDIDGHRLEVGATDMNVSTIDEMYLREFEAERDPMSDCAMIKDSAGWGLAFHSSCEVKLKHKISENNTQVNETYYEDVYDYKPETTSTCATYTITVPTGTTLTERLALKTEMQSKGCYLTKDEAISSCGVKNETI